MEKDQANFQFAALYILRTYPGVESKVKGSLEDRFRKQNLAPDAWRIIIPVKEDGKPEYSGFVLLKMKIIPAVWSLVRNTPGVIGFVGMGNTPTPFNTEDWKTISLKRFAN